MQTNPVEVLVVDDEVFFTTIIDKLLSAKGFRVRMVNSAVDGLAEALERVPDLIISDILMPEVDGWAFLKLVRSQAPLATVPFLFLTAIPEPEMARIKGFRLGADDFIPKADMMDELVVRVEAILYKREMLAVEQQSAAAFAGSLEVLGVATVLQMVAQEGKTGVLTFAQPNGKAEVFVINGSLTAAELPLLELQGEDVVYELLGWESGTFQFAPGPPFCRRNIESSMQALLLEGARRIDERFAAGA